MDIVKTREIETNLSCPVFSFLKGNLEENFIATKISNGYGCLSLNVKEVKNGYKIILSTHSKLLYFIGASKVSQNIVVDVNAPTFNLVKWILLLFCLRRQLSEKMHFILGFQFSGSK